MVDKEKKLQQQREINRRYRERHKERLNLEKKEWLEANPDKRKATTKRYREKTAPQLLVHRLENYEWYLWNAARTRSKRLGTPFNIEVDDVVIPEKCPYLGFPLTRIVGGGRPGTNPSIDKIIPELGYVKGNIEIISDKANRMKNDGTPEQLVLFAKEILKRYD